MIHRRPAVALAAAAFLLGPVTLTACGASDSEPPAICSDIDELKTSVDHLKNVNVAQNGLASLEDSLTQVQTDLKNVINDAKKQYTTDVDAVREAVSSLGAALDAAIANPSAQTVATVGTAVRALGASVTALQRAAESTC